MKKAIIWGHKLGSHTCSYVFNGYYRAFQFLGYETHWFDDNDNVSNFDFSNCVFFTESQVDKKIPLRNDCGYILHNCSSKYRDRNLNLVNLQVFDKTHCGTKINNYTYLQDRTLFQPWATDLLPSEILPITTPRDNSIYFVGSVINCPGGGNDSYHACNEFARAARTKNINFKVFGGYSTQVRGSLITFQGGFLENNTAISLIKKAYLAPTIQSPHQLNVGYVPCRIFKNISYGQYAITNNRYLRDLFEEEIICNENPYDLFFDAEAKKENQKLEKLMQIVREKHTYVNRVLELEKVLNA